VKAIDEGVYPNRWISFRFRLELEVMIRPGESTPNTTNSGSQRPPRGPLREMAEVFETMDQLSRNELVDYVCPYGCKALLYLPKGKALCCVYSR
jgi:hypothetical protein